LLTSKRDTFVPGTGIGKDDTIFATREGTVEFRQSGDRRTIAVV